MTEEEYFRKNYPDYCYYDMPLSPYWDLFQDGVEFGERQSEKKIEELEKENAELKEKYNKVDVIGYDALKNLTNAEDIIRALLFHLTEDTFYVTLETRKQSVERARQFLRRRAK